MVLPDLTRLDRLSDDDLRALRERLRAIGLDAEAIDRVMAPSRAIPSVLREPLLHWYARRAPGDAGLAIRALVVGDPVAEAELARGLGATLVGKLLDVGVLARGAHGAQGDAGLVSPYALRLFDETLVLVDRAHDPGAIAPPLGTTALMAAAYPAARVGGALDLGCGAGALAIVLAANAEHVVGVDARPRAIALARFNARLNAVRNVEFVEGDGFAPLAGRSFDLVTARPAFDADDGTEEPALAALADASAHLAPSGRAVFLVDWPELDDAPPIASRLRARLDAAVDLLVLLGPRATIDELCVQHAAALAADLGPAFGELVLASRERLGRLGVNALRPSFTVVRRRAGVSHGFTASLDIGPLGHVQPSSARIGRLLATQELLAGPETELLGASLRIPPKTTIVTEREASDPGATVTAHARFSPRALVPPLGLNDEAATLAQLVHQTGSIGEALAFYQRTLSVDAATARAKLLPHAREALERGLLEPAPGG